MYEVYVKWKQDKISNQTSCQYVSIYLSIACLSALYLYNEIQISQIGDVLDSSQKIYEVVALIA